jgi:3-phosphoshikimate 1-carboxyvinyltransferase
MSELTIKNVGINETRTGILDVLTQMQADLKICNKSISSFEPRADICIRKSNLKPYIIEKEMLPRLIDEVPILMIAATQAHGTSCIKNASELRVKETDRIKSMTEGLKQMGAAVEVEGDDIYIKGPTHLKATQINSYSDHRTAMSFLIAGLVADGKTTVNDTACINTSFPGFYEKLMQIIA